MAGGAGVSPGQDDRLVHRLGAPAFSRLAVLVIGAAAISLCIRAFYYHIFEWVLGFNLTFEPGVLTPWIAGWTNERDGIEIYVVYVSLFAIIALSGALMLLMAVMRPRWMRWLLLAALTPPAWVYVSSLVFTPPSDQPSRRMLIALGLIGVFGFLALWRWLPERLWLLIVLVVLAPLCFVITSPVAASNYAYMLLPALRLLDGVAIQDIYFQYDFLISALAAGWLKHGLDPNQFQFVGALANYAAILAIFLMARHLFQTRMLAYLLVAALVLFRILSAPWDPVYVFQITPLRLDLWLIPFLIIYLRGPWHVLVPVVCGLLIVVHGSFGLIYTIGYVQLMLTLCGIALMDEGWRAKAPAWLARRNLMRIGLIGVYLATCYLLARFLFGRSLDATALYQKIGIGFIPLAQTSFFWLLPVVLSSLWVLLFAIRRSVSNIYLALGYAALYFFAGNCVYFLGRSHELNLFSIGISLVFVVFFAFDAASRYVSLVLGPGRERYHGVMPALLGSIFLILVVMGCGNRIVANLVVKFDGIRSLSLSPSDAFAGERRDIEQVENSLANLLGAEARVQFFVLDETKEFLFYEGRQQGASFFSPLYATVFVAELVQSARDMLNDGRYLLLDSRVEEALLSGGLSSADFGYKVSVEGYSVIGRRPPGE